MSSLTCLELSFFNNFKMTGNRIKSPHSALSIAVILKIPKLRIGGEDEIRNTENPVTRTIDVYIIPGPASLYVSLISAVFLYQKIK